MRSEVLTDVYGLLQNDPVLTELCGPRVFCGTALRSPIYPFIVYSYDYTANVDTVINDGFLAIDVYDNTENLSRCEAITTRVLHLLDHRVIPDSSGIRFYLRSNDVRTEPDGTQWGSLRFKVRGPDNYLHSYRLSII